MKRAHTTATSALVLAICGACFSPAASAQPKPSPPHLDPVNRTLWSDTDLGIRFTYPGVWQPTTSTQSSTQVVVSWRLKKSKALLATCYVEVHDSRESQLAALRAADIHSSGKSIAESSVKNMRQRAPNAALLSWRNAVQDGHPIVYIVRQGTIDNKHPMKLYSMVTAWRHREINFECSTSVFGSEYAQLEGGSRLVEQVEQGIMNVMRTLQFDRSVAR